MHGVLNDIQTKGGFMKVVRTALLYILLITFVTAAFSACGSKKNDTYTKGELEKMTASDLYETFVRNGLQVDEDLKKVLTDKELAVYIKNDFDLLIEGTTSRDHMGYGKLADDIKRIYSSILKKE